MIKTINPYNGTELKSYKEDTAQQIDDKLKIADIAFKEWRKTDMNFRAKLIKRVGELLRKNANEYARQMAMEMGKPISQGKAEAEKCAWLCDYYADNAAGFLDSEQFDTDYHKSYVTYEPIGVVLAVMPWNYPFWQVMRFIVPALMAGNVGVLKHSSSVMGCAIMLEELFKEAGFLEGCLKNLTVSSDPIEFVIKSPIIKAVTLTGSKPAGSAVASTAGSEIKKTVLELGGSNALVVFDDADIDNAVDTCVDARYQNTGQSCIAGKRLLLHKEITSVFLQKLTNKVMDLKVGDPLHEDTYIGVMARADLAEELEETMHKSVNMGADIHLGGKRKDAFFEPTILTNVTKEMPVFKEETFGPLLSVTLFESDQEAIDLVNESEFGLGVSLFSENTERMEKMVSHFDDGSVFINEKVSSHPNLPFGGTGISGYGRELSRFGIREFVNIKTVVVNKY
ncbi:succinate-semialdehyde dehydrogenase / glutarate-semialdehyde dehydrogenase [Nonlabens sp. Hel1_33_55]|uniref:NAD-dependent succinate-semialdehyde dehydrogenase n=1 Tax=Nonlabens sp. Hel1_33_55 TaxID=1336802 RepID=UPI000875AF98|nr:NAD-dependent succinate-semialdehyde dehydrogenase [Nonlabens sp. Hel1_33_55]SCY08690.1 succinate-semialdehyde dehydrogenase / glutarate-semialdehyde dehydrogenase [Nonlabens sp. Hel1_33_55]